MFYGLWQTGRCEKVTPRFDAYLIRTAGPVQPSHSLSCECAGIAVVDCSAGQRKHDLAEEAPSPTDDF
jgi:hypothetical protein